MTVGEFLKSSSRKLQDNGISSARLDCLILLEDALGTDRANLIAHPETELSPLTEVDLNNKIVQRSRHIPLAYIRGQVEFYGRKFKVDSHVLVPRPETEDIINLLLKVNPKDYSAQIADIGTGSGCIGITASLEIPNSSVDLYDLSPAALEIARQNSTNLKAKVNIYKSDLLKDLRGNYSIILTNLPYVPNSYPINMAAKNEPPLALFAGDDGMDLYREFWDQIGDLSHKPKHVITESLLHQHVLNTELAGAQNYKLIESAGLSQSYALK